jgi:CRP/FNR family transcriptional regulator, anaerobic regulatory protein
MPDSVVIAGLETSAREVLARDARTVVLKAGQKAFSPGQPCEAFLIVKTGSVRVSTVTESGRELVLYRVGPRQTCVLTTAALLASADYDAEGVAETDMEAVAIPKPLFEDLLGRSAAFRHFVFTSFGDRLRDLIALVQEVSQRQVDRRLARFLVERGAAGTIAATHQDIAAELGTAREVVSRLLKQFEAEGLVRLERRQIEIADRDKLALLHGGM